MSLGLSHRTTGDLITASIWNTDLIDVLNSIGGKYLIPIDGKALTPDLTNGCATPGDQTLTAGNPLLSGPGFSGTLDKFAQFSISMPKAWNASTVTFVVHWATPNTLAGAVVFSLAAVAVSDGDNMNASYGTAVKVTDTYQATGTKHHRTSESTAITIAGTPAKLDMVHFRFGRLAASDAADTKNDDIYVKCVDLFVTTDAVNDA